MDREINISNYLPTILREIRELKEVSQLENPELYKLWIALENVMADQFVEDATENGVQRLEQILNIYPKGTESLQERKFRVLVRLNEQLPYTYRVLNQQLRTLCGEDGYKLAVNHADYSLTVKISLTAKSNFTDVENLLNRIVPANILIDLTLLYNQHQNFTALTYEQLAGYTHAQLREEVMN